MAPLGHLSRQRTPPTITTGTSRKLLPRSLSSNQAAGACSRDRYSRTSRILPQDTSGRREQQIILRDLDCNPAALRTGMQIRVKGCQIKHGTRRCGGMETALGNVACKPREGPIWFQNTVQANGIYIFVYEGHGSRMQTPGASPRLRPPALSRPNNFRSPERPRRNWEFGGAPLAAPPYTGTPAATRARQRDENDAAPSTAFAMARSPPRQRIRKIAEWAIIQWGQATLGNRRLPSPPRSRQLLRRAPL